MLFVVGGCCCVLRLVTPRLTVAFAGCCPYCLALRAVAVGVRCCGCVCSLCVVVRCCVVRLVWHLVVVLVARCRCCGAGCSVVVVVGCAWFLLLRAVVVVVACGCLFDAL